MDRRNFIAGTSLAAVTVPANMALASKELRSNPSAVANVMDFGAVGNGIVNDTAAIQNAIAYVNSLGGGLVIIPTGNYLITQKLILYKNISIRGESRFTTKILPGAFNLTCFEFVSVDAPAPAFIEMSDFEIDCRTFTGVVGINLYRCWHSYFININFAGCLYNMVADRSKFLTLRDCFSRGVSGGSFKAGSLRFYSSDVGDYSSNIMIQDYTLRNLGNGVISPCIFLHRCVAASIQGFRLNDGYVNSNADVIVLSGDCQGCAISDMVVAGCNAGIRFLGDIIHAGSNTVPTFCLMTDVQIDQPQYSCILIQAGARLTVTAGTFTSSGVNTSARAVTVTSGHSLVLNGLRIHGFSTGHGIICSSLVNKVIVNGCDIQNCQFGIGVVPPSGTKFVITSNFFDNCSNPIVFGPGFVDCVIRNNAGALDLT